MKCLKLLVSVSLFACLYSTCFGDGVSSKLNIVEQDGSPSTFPYKLKVTNNSLTDNGDGTASLQSFTTSFSQIAISGTQLITNGTNPSTEYVFQVPDAQSLWIGPNQNIQTIFGTFGTFVGAGAGISGAAGGFSSGFGNGALAALTSGAESSGFGYGACAALQSGDYNTCFGANSGASNVSASRTTNIGGINACYYNTVDDTMCIGFNSGLPGGAGTNQTTGTKNVFIGNYTGHSGGQWIGGGALGYNALMRGNNQFQMGGIPGSGFEFRTMMTSATIDYTASISSNAVIDGTTFYQNGGITTSGPVNIVAPNTGSFEFMSSTSAATFHVLVSTNGHMVSYGLTPTVSSCGSGPAGTVVGNDNSGVITVGGTAPTACTLTFANSWSFGSASANVSCNINDNSLTIGADISGLTSTVLTLGFGVGGLAGGTVYYNCSCAGPGCK